jgi:hypothetical protein
LWILLSSGQRYNPSFIGMHAEAARLLQHMHKL